MLRNAVLIFLAVVILCCVAAAWIRADEPPTLRVFCFPECKFCRIFEADAQHEPLRSSLAKFRIEKHGKADARRFGVSLYPTFRIEGGPIIRVKEGYEGPDSLIRWMEGR